jgi:hypothetical protein
MNEQLDLVEVQQENFIYNYGLGVDSMGLNGDKAAIAELKLLENGMILDCNKASAELLGCVPDKLKWQKVDRLLPQLTGVPLLLDENINPYLRFLSTIGHRFEVIGMNDRRFACELFFSMAETVGKSYLKLVMRPVQQGQHMTPRNLKKY